VVVTTVISEVAQRGSSQAQGQAQSPHISRASSWKFALPRAAARHSGWASDQDAHTPTCSASTEAQTVAEDTSAKDEVPQTSVEIQTSKN
jgi:hypothetical protein